MKSLLAALLFSLATLASSQAQTKATINRKAKTFDLTANMKEDHQIFGYAAPSVKAPKLILFSIFTSDVEGNPKKYPLGAYYETSKLKRGEKIVYVAETPGFVKLNYINAAAKITTFYIQRKFIEFE